MTSEAFSAPAQVWQFRSNEEPETSGHGWWPAAVTCFLCSSRRGWAPLPHGLHQWCRGISSSDQLGHLAEVSLKSESLKDPERSEGWSLSLSVLSLRSNLKTWCLQPTCWRIASRLQLGSARSFRYNPWGCREDPLQVQVAWQCGSPVLPLPAGESSGSADPGRAPRVGSVHIAWLNGHTKNWLSKQRGIYTNDMHHNLSFAFGPQNIKMGLRSQSVDFPHGFDWQAMYLPTGSRGQNTVLS